MRAEASMTLAASGRSLTPLGLLTVSADPIVQSEGTWLSGFTTASGGSSVAGMQAAGAVNPPGPGTDERIIEAFYGLQGSQFGHTIVYDLVFTDRRIVGIVFGYTYGGNTGGPIAGTLLIRESRKPRPAYRPEDLDRMVAKHPKAFSFPYAAVQEAAIKGVLEKAIQIRSGREKYYIYLPKDQLARMEAILARITLRGPA